MKPFKYFSIFMLMLFAVACSEPCDSVDCSNGTCDDGTCMCLDGWIKDAEGLCTITRNTLFEGTYTSSKTCQSDGIIVTDTILVDTGTNPNDVMLRNFEGIANNDIRLTISSSDVITISPQTTIAGYDYSGAGTRLNSVLSFSLYKIADTCQVSLTKQ